MSQKASEMSPRKKLILGSVTGACLIAAGVLFYMQFSRDTAAPVTPEAKEAAVKNDAIQQQMQAAQPKPPTTPAAGGDFERKTTRGAVVPN